MAHVTLNEFKKHERLGTELTVLGRQMSKRLCKYIFGRNAAYNRSLKKGQDRGEYRGTPPVYIVTPVKTKKIEHGVPFVRV